MIKRATNSYKNRARGASVPEFAVALVVGLPIVIAIIFTIIECSIYFNIKTNLDVAARQAARQLSVAYGQDPTMINNPAAVNAVYQTCLIPNIVNDVGQFSNPPQFVSGTPGTITVVVTYPVDGSYNLAPFPQPDPLHLKGRLQPYAIATFAVQ